MTINEIINIILSSIVAFTAIISIIIAIMTMKQNSKMIEESTRPIINVYSKYSDGILYIIIKNLGQSIAFIDNVETDFYIEEENNMVEGNPFSNLKSGSLPPNSSRVCPLISHTLKTRKFSFKISYHSTTKKYIEHYIVDCDAENPFPDAHTTIQNKQNSDVVRALEAVAHTLQDIYKTKL